MTSKYNKVAVAGVCATSHQLSIDGRHDSIVLTASAVRKLRDKLPEILSAIDHVLFCSAISVGLGANPALSVLKKAGLSCNLSAPPTNVIGSTGLTAIKMGVDLIASGKAHVVLVCSGYCAETDKYLFYSSSAGDSNMEFVDTYRNDALLCPHSGFDLFELGETFGRSSSISPDALMQYRRESIERAKENIATYRELYSITEDEGIGYATQKGCTEEELKLFGRNGKLTQGQIARFSSCGAALVLTRADISLQQPVVEDFAEIVSEPQQILTLEIEAVEKLLSGQSAGKDQVPVNFTEVFLPSAVHKFSRFSNKGFSANMYGGSFAFGYTPMVSDFVLVHLACNAIKEGRAVQAAASSFALGGIASAMLLSGRQE